MFLLLLVEMSLAALAFRVPSLVTEGHSGGAGRLSALLRLMEGQESVSLIT